MLGAMSHILSSAALYIYARQLAWGYTYVVTSASTSQCCASLTKRCQPGRLQYHRTCIYSTSAPRMHVTLPFALTHAPLYAPLYIVGPEWCNSLRGRLLARQWLTGTYFILAEITVCRFCYRHFELTLMAKRYCTAGDGSIRSPVSRRTAHNGSTRDQVPAAL
jgi:hypothetical protein